MMGFPENFFFSYVTKALPYPVKIEIEVWIIVVCSDVRVVCRFEGERAI